MLFIFLEFANLELILTFMLHALPYIVVLNLVQMNGEFKIGMWNEVRIFELRF